MKKGITMLFGTLLFFSCEDVIDIDLPEVETRLVVDGLVRVDKSQEFVDVKIKLKESSIFFEENQPTQAESVLIYYEMADIYILLKIYQQYSKYNIDIHTNSK